MAESETLSPVEDLKKNGFHVTRITGVSMMPLLRQGKDTVQIVSGVPKKGDVALYCLNQGDKCVLHRVIAVKGDTFIFRGDNCVAKEYVPKDKVFGVLSLIWRDGKEIDVTTDKKYRRYCRFLRATAFIRIPYKKIKFKLKRLFKKV